jgi:hypothetical protein
MFCVNCGHPYESGHYFCNFCGHPLEASQLRFVVTEADRSSDSVATAAVQRLEEPPTPLPSVDTENRELGTVEGKAAPASAPRYADFVGFALMSATMASIVAFIVADDIARAEWKSMLLAVLASVLCLLFLKRSLAAHGELKMSGVNDVVLGGRKLLIRCVIFAVIFIGTAAIVGAVIGLDGAETNQYISDLQHFKEIGGRISSARDSAAQTVPAQIEMYRAIEPDVKEFESVMTRLRAEATIYDQKYPEAHQTQSIEVAKKRADLLRRQVEIAKSMQSLSPGAQWHAWRYRCSQYWMRRTDSMLLSS